MTLKKLLGLDGITCALMGVVLVTAAPALEVVLDLPQHLLLAAGYLLFPIAAFMAAMAWWTSTWMPGVRLIIAGNLAWVAASIAVLLLTGPNALGAVFLVAQALVVALLALAEARAVAQTPQIARGTL